MEARPADRGPHLQRLRLKRVTNKSVGEVIEECVQSNVEMERGDVRRGCGESWGFEACKCGCVESGRSELG